MARGFLVDKFPAFWYGVFEMEILSTSLRVARPMVMVEDKPQGPA